jgi:hypothetical protein
MVPLETVRHAAALADRGCAWALRSSVDRSVAPRPSWLINDEEMPPVPTTWRSAIGIAP